MSRTAKVSGEAALAGMRLSDSLCGKASPACYNRRAAFRIHRAPRRVTAQPAPRAGLTPLSPPDNSGMPERGRLRMRQDRAKATALILFGREVVTFSWRKYPVEFYPQGWGAETGVPIMSFLKTRESAEVDTLPELEVE